MSLFTRLLLSADHRDRRTRGRKPAHRRAILTLDRLEERQLLSTTPTVYTVTNLNSSGSGSLLSAVTQANAQTGNPAGSSIQFAEGLTGQITLASTLTLNETDGPEVITGPGANLVTISGNNAMQVFNVSNTATISSLIIANGSASEGGGIYNSGTLTVTNDTVTGNSAATFGAAIDNNGALTVNSSTFTNNSGSTSVCYGGGIYNSGTTTVNNSTFANNGTNTALYEIYEGGGISNHGTMVVSDSAFSGNSTDEQGGGIGNGQFGLMTIINSTIANNSTYALGGGIFNCYGGTLTATNCTIADNSGCYGGGLLSYNRGWGTTTVLSAVYA